MSCNCNNTNTADSVFACPCDRVEHPQALRINAGLIELPRQLAAFPEYRQAMLFAIRSKPPLASWQARKQDDTGVMLLEMWAYVCDVLSFYDKVIAQETYLRTASQRAALRRLVALLGYLPRPAVGATVQLAALAEGRQPVVLPAGTAFRSAAFNGQPPQVFELDQDTLIHPLTNRWNIRAPRPGKILSANPLFLLITPRTAIREGDVLLLTDSGNSAQNQALHVTAVSPYTATDGAVYTKLTFSQPLKLAANTPLSRLNLYAPLHEASLWTNPGEDASLNIISSAVFLSASANVSNLAASIFDDENASVTSDSVVLDGLYRQIKAGSYILLQKGQEARWFKVNSTSEVIRQPTPAGKIKINGSSFDMPGISVPVTRLKLDAGINAAGRKAPGAANWGNASRASLVVHYGMQFAGGIADEPASLLLPDDPLAFTGQIETPVEERNPDAFLLSDKNNRGVAISGRIDFPNAALIPDQGEAWQPGLVLPVTAYGNVISASRGEQVNAEVLGSGNASQINQAFKLKKKPLTYLSSPTAENDQGVKSTLTIYVDGVRWTEVAGFYGRRPDDQVFIVRQNDEGDSIITFGDGVRGQRLPTGANNVVAWYRHGAGQAAPPAGSVNQIARPFKGLQSVNNPLSAAGGADAEPAEGMRTYAPKSALILGRAVSIQDMEAVVLSMPGVRGVQAAWRWHGVRQCALVHIWYLGEAGLETALSQRLRNVSDPAVIIQVEQATAAKAKLSIAVKTDPRYLEADVLAGVRENLTNIKSGILAPENIGIGRSLFRSRIFAAVLSVPGAMAVSGIYWNGKPFNDFAKTPGAGKYFNFEQENALQLNNNSLV
ncbi:hypothetical protein L3C95_33070 [Chitinophaga filiformis]|uniref:hypothetical protein n=1 Tax=Chitinophaga filiformis TaxID=104663 RepID=UPI001F2F3634|nr:hypothetical protein [Chitinophaga filiformis]MCF6407766.1 hypothetical protein [Chitinophaga filiformis]